MSNKVTPSESNNNIATMAASKKSTTHLYLGELSVGVTDAIVVIVGRVWDVNATTDRYLRTDLSTYFVVSDSKGNMIHCTAGTIAHNFVWLKEGVVYLIKNFTVLPNEFRIFRHDLFMLEFDGSTTMRKVSVGFVRYAFQLVDFDEIELASNKFLIDVNGYVTNVGRKTYTKSGSKTLDFYLANETITLWGGIGDTLIEKKTANVGMCAVVLASMFAKMYNHLVEPNKEMIIADPSHPREGTTENLLLWVRNRKNDAVTFHCNVVIEDIRRKSGGNYPSCGRDKCRKSITRQLRKFLCETCHKAVDYPVLRYRLEVVVADDTANILFNELATELLKCSADSLIQMGDTDGTGLPTAISNLIGTSHVMELKSHTYYEYGSYESFTCWKINLAEVVADGASSNNQLITVDDSEPFLKRLSKQPTVSTPSKPVEEKRKERSDVEDSDTDEVSCPAKEVKELDTDGRLAKK